MLGKRRAISDSSKTPDGSSSPKKSLFSSPFCNDVSSPQTSDNTSLNAFSSVVFRSSKFLVFVHAFLRLQLLTSKEISPKSSASKLSAGSDSSFELLPLDKEISSQLIFESSANSLTITKSHAQHSQL